MRKKSMKKEWTAILAAFIAAILFVCVFMMVERKMLSAYEKIPVVVAATEIDAGTQITKDNLDTLFHVLEIPNEYVISDAVVQPESLVGHVIKNTIHEKEMISPLDIVDRQSWMEDLAEPIEFTFSASSISAAVAGTIRGGDTIDVGIVYQRDNGIPQYDVVGREIYVKEVYSDSGTMIPRSDKETICTMFRVVMEKMEGEQLIEKLRQGDEVVVTLPK